MFHILFSDPLLPREPPPFDEIFGSSLGVLVSLHPFDLPLVLSVDKVGDRGVVFWSGPKAVRRPLILEEESDILGRRDPFG